MIFKYIFAILIVGVLVWQGICLGKDIMRKKKAKLQEKQEDNNETTK